MFQRLGHSVGFLLMLMLLFYCISVVVAAVYVTGVVVGSVVSAKSERAVLSYVSGRELGVFSCLVYWRETACRVIRWLNLCPMSEVRFSMLLAVRLLEALALPTSTVVAWLHSETVGR